jgi:CPA1 family monovalent cation:H+ antiporter
MDAFSLAALFLGLIGVAGWINSKFLNLPNAVAMALAGGTAALAVLLVSSIAPDSDLGRELAAALVRVDFPTAILRYLLAFLLFAGAMQVDLAALRASWGAVLSLATLGTLASTFIVGVGAWALAQAFGVPLTLPWAIAFGALISPTDPVAVLAAVHRAGLSRTLKTILQGEALFNDGVGIVVFTAAVAIASAGGQADIGHEIVRVGVEALGAVAFGVLCSGLVLAAMRAIDDYAVEVALSLALATGVYAGAAALHLSAPIAVAVAGIIVGNMGARGVMSETTQQYLRGFWTLTDEILNALLFALFGLQATVIVFDWRHGWFWAAVTALVLAARALVVAPWAPALGRRGERGVMPVLVWGGMHGALSAALALLVPAGPARDVIVPLTFAVVAFSILVQGSTFTPLARRYAPDRSPVRP